ncbi:MAG: S-layer homology domain-containing protein [Oscillospiraceae bacterium]|nr:S-layer homology domain-containing protein [Oscillospiraceae bacterium]
MRNKLTAALLCVIMALSAFSMALAVGNPVPGFYNLGSAEGVEIRAASSKAGPINAVNINVDGIPGEETFYPDSDSIRVTLPSTNRNAMYMVLLAEKNESETIDKVFFADQAYGGSRLTFNVFCALPDRPLELVLYISSDDEGFETVAVPLYYMSADKSVSQKNWEYNLCPKDYSCVLAGFSDLAPGEWYHDGVHYALDKGIMNGYSGDRFAPGEATSRAMIVTMLWRMEGSPATAAELTFKDVPADMWYSESIRWAMSADIVGGYSAETFGPNDPLTREQLAVILWRYALYKGNPDTSADDNAISEYGDAEQVSAWAVEGVSWAAAQGIITGTGSNSLSPAGSATRAQVATMLMRYCTQ